MCLFQTFVFVAYNKVCTSQYFLWYLSLLPLVLPTLQLSKYDAITSLALWGFTQVKIKILNCRDSSSQVLGSSVAFMALKRSSR